MDSTEDIRVKLNGESKSFPRGISIQELLTELFPQPNASAKNRKFAAVAVEVNSEIIPHDQFETSTLKDNDHIEVVTLVGGG